MKIYALLTDTNHISDLSLTRNTNNEIEIEVTKGHEVINDPFNFKFENGRLIKDESHRLQKHKEMKMDSLNEKCEGAILGYFKSNVNGEEYDFSYDMEAQSRFNGVASSFSLGIINEVQWTAHKDGERYRLTLTKDQFIQVAKDAFVHQDSNIVKYNELILAVKSAQTKAELDKIVW